MARSNFRVEQGIEIWDANGTANSWVLRGAAAPLGTSGPTDDAPVSSIYMDDSGTGQLYQKKTSTSLATDWKRFVNESLYTALGVAFDDEDMGTFTGSTISDNVSTKAALQELESALEAISGGGTSTTNIAAGTPTSVSPCFTSACNGSEWEVTVYEQGDQQKKEFFKHTSLHNGETGPYVDATAFDESTHTKESIAKIPGLTFTSKLTGSGDGVQTLSLEISATAAITAKVRRTDIV